MKRFWQDVVVEERDGGHAILLDERVVKTPLHGELILPNEALANAVLAEWAGVGEEVDPATMPMTGFANAAIDKVASERATFVDTIAAYGEADLFCYRAENPRPLVDRQDEQWGKWLRWAQAHYSLSFTVISGIIHQPQPEDTVARLKEAVEELSDWQLAAASKLAHISGSLVAMLALVDEEASAAVIWPDLILDELWQEEHWGADEFALKNRQDREVEFMDAARFMTMCR
ncbi:MAG: ATP12 family protein [Sphingorhabdus sp.]